LALLGLSGIALYSWLYFWAVQANGIAIAIALIYTSPVWVNLFAALFLGERLHLRKGMGVILALGGGLLTTEAWRLTAGPSFGGLAVGLVAAVAYGAYTLFGRLAVHHRNLDPGQSVLYAFLFAALFSLVAIPRTSGDSPILWGEAALPMAMLVGGTLAAFGFYTRGLRGLPAGEAILVATCEPITAVLLATLLFHEPFTLLQAIGLALMVAGWRSVPKRRVINERRRQGDEPYPIFGLTRGDPMEQGRPVPWAWGFPAHSEHRPSGWSASSPPSGLMRSTAAI
jgi:DME family drug/metabolite transporter